MPTAASAEFRANLLRSLQSILLLSAELLVRGKNTYPELLDIVGVILPESQVDAGSIKPLQINIERIGSPAGSAPVYTSTGFRPGVVQRKEETGAIRLALFRGHRMSPGGSVYQKDMSVPRGQIHLSGNSIGWLPFLSQIFPNRPNFSEGDLKENQTSLFA